MPKTSLSRRWTVVVNPPLLIAWAFFWVYGFYAAVSLADSAVMFAINIALTLIFVYLMDLAGTAQKSWFTVSKADCAVVAAFLGLTVSIGWREVTDSICNDQFYHMQEAFAHGLRLLAPDVLPPSSALGQKLLHVPYRVILYAANLIIQLGLMLLFTGLHKLPRQRAMRAVVAAIGFWSLRLAVSSLIVQDGIQPPLRLLWLNAGTLIFGINDFALRLPALLSLAVVVAYLVRRLNTKLGPPAAWALAFAVGTLPLFWHVGTMAEASIWAGIAFVVVALAPFLDQPAAGTAPEQKQSFNFLPLYSLVAIMSLCRQSVFIACLPLIAFHACYALRDLLCEYRAKKRRPHLSVFLRKNGLPALRRMWSMGYPLIIIVPWTLFIAHTGTPATDHSGLTLTTKVSEAVGSGAAFRFLRQDFGWPWFLLMLVGLLPWCRRNLFVLCHFILSLLLFYSITPYLWGAGRYQLEIGAAAAVSGLIEIALLTTRFRLSARAITGLWVVAGTALIGYNIRTFKSIHNVSGIVDNVDFFPRSRDGSLPMLAEISYAFGDALTDIKHRGLSKGLYLDGTLFWVGSQILAGYDFEEISWNNQLPSPTAATPPDVIDRNMAIRSAIYADRGEELKQATIRYLQSRGWALVATYPHYGLKDNLIYLMVRQ